MRKIARPLLTLSSSYGDVPPEDLLPQEQASFSSDQPLLFTVKQAAALLNISVATMYRLIQTEAIPSLLIRGSRRISREALQQ